MGVLVVLLYVIEVTLGHWQYRANTDISNTRPGPWLCIVTMIPCRMFGAHEVCLCSLSGLIHHTPTPSLLWILMHQCSRRKPWGHHPDFKASYCSQYSPALLMMLLYLDNKLAHGLHPHLIPDRSLKICVVTNSHVLIKSARRVRISDH